MRIWPHILLSVAALVPFFLSEASANTPDEIFSDAARAIVYLEAQNSDGTILISGTGFIVSRDGYIITVAHNFPDGATKLFAVVGARQGVQFQLERREQDNERDVAIWQLPQSSSCRQIIPLSATSPKVFDRVLALGFPGDSGLTPGVIGIQNLSTPLGLLRGDGLLQTGYSGGPVMNESGEVIGIVQGGTIGGAQANDFIPIAAALDLLRKRTTTVELGKLEPYALSCYSKCRHPNHGVERWGTVQPWPGSASPDGKAWSGRLGGGNGRRQVCDGLIAAYLAQHPGSVIDVPNDNEHLNEESDKDILGHVEYRYWCRGTEMRDPVYKLQQSDSCPLWD
ncbi:serine protease [Rhizobium sp. Root1204]|uniref:S1 family peptidase n=1 Tax=Rhizobium sp. Root1204 TaxID=1736428 RepID=UPI0009E8BE0C|nr:serine protease [Rhizobium sp. Root1204]